MDAKLATQSVSFFSLSFYGVELCEYEVFDSKQRNIYPVRMIFFNIILSGSTLFKEPTAATIEGLASPTFFVAIKGRGGNEIGAYIEATENRPG